MADHLQLMDAFSAAVATALAEMAGAEAMRLDSQSESGSRSIDGVSAILTMNAASRGFLLLTMPEQTAAGLAHRILATTVPHPDATMIRDCIGEVANVIAGQAKTLLYGTPWHFSFSAPWSKVPQSVVINNALRMSFGSDMGPLALVVEFPS